MHVRLRLKRADIHHTQILMHACLHLQFTLRRLQLTKRSVYHFIFHVKADKTTV